jgi:hypothetical protein
MDSRGNFWPDLHNLYLSLASEGDTDHDRLEHVRSELERFPPVIRDELASNLSALSSALDDLADMTLESLTVSGSHSAT